MPDIALFLGAGASKDFDIPTVENLVAGFPDPVATIYNKAKAKSPNLMIEDFLQYLTDLERLATDDAGNEILRHFGYEPSAANHLQSMKESTFNYIRHECRVRNDKVEDACAAYGALLGPALKARVYPRVFTTNYDKILETVCDCNEYEYLMGFSESAGGTSPVWTNRFAVRKLSFFKLHGSVDWHKTDTGDIVLGQQPNSSPSSRVLMMYPVRGKPYFDEPYVTLYLQYLRILRQTPLVFVIGSQLQDPNVTEPLRDMLASKRASRIWIVDPNATEIKRKLGLETGVEKVQPIDKTFLEWIEDGAAEWMQAIEQQRGLDDPRNMILQSHEHKVRPYWP